MVMLSDLLGYRLDDRRGARARLRDFAIDPEAGEYPTVTAAIAQRRGESPRVVPWGAVSPRWGERRLLVDDLERAQPLDVEEQRRAVLLERDVLDALVLDLEQRQAARANDLWLRDEAGKLALRGVDLSAWAILRRLGRGWLGRGAERRLLDWRQVEYLRGDPHGPAAPHHHPERVAALPPTQIARLSELIPYLHAAELLTRLEDALAADVLEAMATERQLQVFEELDEGLGARLLARMAPDVAADLLGRLEPEQAARCLEALPERRRSQVVDLLRYPDDTAGGIMTNEVVMAAGDARLGEARQQLAEALVAPDFVYYVYVVDDVGQRTLRGVLSLRDLLVGDERRRLDELMNPVLETLDPLASAARAARKVADAGLAALPVVARDGRLLGAVTFDAAMEQIAGAAWRQQAPRVFA